MKANGRRDWIKKSSLFAGTLALTPYEIWAKRSLKSQQNNRKFLYPDNSIFNEFTPPANINFNTVKARLAWNENPYGPSPKAVEAYTKAISTGNLYSWFELGGLVNKIAEFENVNPLQILMGPGSTDLLERTGAYYFRSEGNVISGDPSYMSLVEVAQASGAKWKAVKLTKTFEHDLEAMEKAIDSNTNLIYITNPNNPTGTTTNTEKLIDFCSRVSEKVPVFIDEAYLELADNGLKNSMVPLVRDGKNIIVARTFSKVHGMAGFRVGYIVANEQIIEELSKFTLPGFGVSGPAVAAAEASIADTKNITDCTQKLVDTREKTMQFLKSKKLNYIPSQTNFVIFEINKDGQEFSSKLLEKGVLIRTFKFWDTNWCRVSIGKPEEMELFYKAINEIL